MEKTFKIGWGKGAFIDLTIGAAIELAFIIFFFYACAFWAGLALLAVCMVLMWLNYRAISGNRYEICNGEIIVRFSGSTPRHYDIDKIRKIEFIDTGTEWGRYPPNCSHQLAIFFERSYIKSVMPKCFGPEDRETFVDTLLEINPEIDVNYTELRIKLTKYPDCG